MYEFLGQFLVYNRKAMSMDAKEWRKHAFASLPNEQYEAVSQLQCCYALMFLPPSSHLLLHFFMYPSATSVRIQTDDATILEFIDDMMDFVFLDVRP